MLHDFNINWQRLVAGTLVALLLVFNGMSIVQAGTGNHSGDTGQHKFHAETLMLSPASESHKKHGNHANSSDCCLALCSSFTLSNKNLQMNLSNIGLSFYTSTDRLVGIIYRSLDRPPKAIL